MGCRQIRQRDYGRVIYYTANSFYREFDLCFWAHCVQLANFQVLTQAIQDLAVHQEYVEPLRLELKTMSDPVHQLDDLPLLDSFIKESLRTNAFEIGKC